MGSCRAASLVVAKLVMAVGAAALVRLSVPCWALLSVLLMALPLEILYVAQPWVQLWTAPCGAVACVWQPTSSFSLSAIK